MNHYYHEHSSSHYSNIGASVRADHDDHGDHDYHDDYGDGDDDDDNVNVMRGQTYKQLQLPHHGQSQSCVPPDPIIANSLVGDDNVFCDSF